MKNEREKKKTNEVKWKFNAQPNIEQEWHLADGHLAFMAFGI